MTSTAGHPQSYVPNAELQQAAESLLQARRHAILLVEDTAAHAALVRRTLDTTIWEIEHVTRASDALASFERDPYRIVLLDLSLPDGDGLQVLCQLKLINNHAQVIVVTATDKLSISVEAMRKGACDYVVKADPTESVQQIQEALERAWQARMREAENQLMEKTKILELVRAERLEAIEVVIKAVCHEVNNPLSGVMALSELLQQHAKSSEELQRLADGIMQSAKQVAQVVQKLKDIGDDPTELKTE